MHLNIKKQPQQINYGRKIRELIAVRKPKFQRKNMIIKAERVVFEFLKFTKNKIHALNNNIHRDNKKLKLCIQYFTVTNNNDE